MEFRRAMAGLCDSPSLSDAFDSLLAGLRLAFGQLKDGAHLHEPYIEMNETLLHVVDCGTMEQAIRELDAYLLRSERALLTTLQRSLASIGSQN